MRKNTYEEALFKIEDEKFELDAIILLARRGLKLIEICEGESDIVKKDDILQKVLRLKLLKKSDFTCGDRDSEEIIDTVKSKILEKVNFIDFCNFLKKNQATRFGKR